MFTVDLVWAYICVPVVLVSILVLIKLRQERASKRIEYVSSEGGKDEEAPPDVHDATAEKSVEVKEPRAKAISETQTDSEPSVEKPKNCLHFLGYLHLKKAPDRTPIPSECYNCSRLLQCLYPPNVIEKVYGNENPTA